MESPLKESLRWIQVVTALLLGFFGSYLAFSLPHPPNVIPPIWIQVFILVIGLTVLIVWFTEPFLVRYLRRNYAYRNYYIEGYWVEKTFKANSKKDLVSLSVLRFSFRGLDPMVSGEIYDPELNMIGTMRSVTVKYHEQKFRFTYEGTHKASPSFALVGHGEFIFAQGKERPMRFNGFLQDNLYFENQVFAQGERITDPGFLQTIDLDSTRKLILRKYLGQEEENSESLELDPEIMKAYRGNIRR